MFRKKVRILFRRSSGVDESSGLGRIRGLRKGVVINMANKGILSKNYYIVPEAVADLGAEVYNMMAEADQAMAEASEIIADIASLTERVPSHIRCNELLEACAAAQAEIKNVDFLSYGQKVEQGLQNLLDHNQYITEQFVKKMGTHTEKMRGLGEEFKRLTDTITYSGEGVQSKGIAFSAVSNAENAHIDENSEKITLTSEELLRLAAVKVSGASSDAYGKPIVNSADEAQKATVYYQYLAGENLPTREELVRRVAARLSGVSLDAYGKPIVNSADEAQKATVYYQYLAGENLPTREELARQAAIRLSGASLNAYGEPIVNSAEEAEKVSAYYQYLKECLRDPGLLITAGLAGLSLENGEFVINDDFDVIKYIEARELVQLTNNIIIDSFQYDWMKSPYVTYGFLDKVIQVSEDLGVSPDDLMTVMAVESEFNPQCGNSSSPVGLIQFTESSINNINQNNGTNYTKDDILAMDEFQQLDLVYLHCEGQGDLSNLGDLYMSLFCPKAVGQNDSFELYVKGSPQYELNKILDSNNDGIITRREVMEKVFERRAEYE